MTRTSKKKKRPNELDLRRKFLLKRPREVTLEFPSPKLVSEDTDKYTKHRHIVNSAQGLPVYEDTLDRELNSIPIISANTVPVQPGSYITDYDGIQMTIVRLSSAFMQCRSRLEWAGTTIRQMEQLVHQKDIELGNTENKPLPKIPYFEEEVTNPGDVYIIHKKVANRFGMIAIGILLGLVMVITTIYLVVRPNA